MNRLTHTWKKGKDTFCAIAACEDKCKNQGVSSCHCSPMMQVRNRLAAYEETGKTPEDVALMQSVMEQDHLEMKKAQEELAAIRAEAERKKGCEWCMPEPNEKLEIECARVGRTDWGYCKTAGRVDGGAIYCPMCGKKLPFYAGTIGGEIVKHAMREAGE